METIFKILFLFPFPVISFPVFLYAKTWITFINILSVFFHWKRKRNKKENLKENKKKPNRYLEIETNIGGENGKQKRN